MNNYKMLQHIVMNLNTLILRKIKEAKAATKQSSYNSEGVAWTSVEYGNVGKSKIAYLYIVHYLEVC